MDQVVAHAAPVDDVDVGPLRNLLGFLLRMAQLQSFEQYFTVFKGLELRPGELSVLMLILHNPGVRQGVLARRMMIKRAHMTKLIRKMESRGYVARAIPDEDRRSVTLKLTADGRNLVRRQWALLERNERAHRGHFSAEQERQLIRLLQVFVGVDPEGGRPMSV
jgi:DNA-binding MarR family transcriptional regulator